MSRAVKATRVGVLSDRSTIRVASASGAMMIESLMATSGGQSRMTHS